MSHIQELSMCHCLIKNLTHLQNTFLKNVFLGVLTESPLLLWQDLASDLRSKRSVVTDTEQNLRLAKNSCDNMATKFQEHCPDIERQEADVQKLNKRFNNLTRQTELRWEGQGQGVTCSLKSVHQYLEEILSTCTVISFAVCFRSQSLQRAKMAYNNYSKDYNNLNSWLSRIPNYEPHETDDPIQVETKLKNQRVRIIYVLVPCYKRIFCQWCLREKA